MKERKVPGTLGDLGAGQSRKAEARGSAALQGTKTATLTAEQRVNLQLAAETCGAALLEPMSFTQADGGAVNPQQGHENCAACVAVYELRRRGLRVAARDYDLIRGSAQEALSDNTRLIWRTPNGLIPQWTTIVSIASNNLEVDLEQATFQNAARFHISWEKYKNSDDGHILTAERTPQGLIFYDPQTNRIESLSGLAEQLPPDAALYVLRVDRLLIDTQLLATVARASQ